MVEILFFKESCILLMIERILGYWRVYIVRIFNSLEKIKNYLKGIRFFEKKRG